MAYIYVFRKENPILGMTEGLVVNIPSGCHKVSSFYP